MTTELYEIEYVEMTPAQLEESKESEEWVEILEIIAEVEGDAFDAIHFWVIDKEWSLIDYRQVKQGVPLAFLSPTHYMAL